MKGETKKIEVSTIQKGSSMVIDGHACKVNDVQTSRPGKHGHAKCRITATGLLDDKKRVIVMPGHDHVDVPVIDKRNAQVLSMSGKHANVMDSETFETFDLEIPAELKEDIVEGCTIVYWIVLDALVMKQVKNV
ncbi:translation initiation factor IF-5A [Candidatus Woesearchaeota archaeon]|jgi:translation initiation factor 5A|nr:translation initiation factor IF-5A [Candidatus Woesearchaeota archaeon]MBT6520120.1 translation initiation factor IF-5A [Candidatus Woesearchaeota archaeon]MBT7366725.1 translation initiation factor IF-5A [Candidatus Woesearchaeota archaeon]